jgi:proteasome lid subunit RPN8/RPN11
VIRVSAEALATIAAHAESSYPEECCGGLLGIDRSGDGRHVVMAVRVGNTRQEERRRRYLIGPEDVQSLENEAANGGLQLVGFYHSHPDHPAQPSAFDRDHAWPWYSYVIVPVSAGEPGVPRAWRLGDDREGFEEQRIIEVNSRQSTVNSQQATVDSGQLLKGDGTT